MQFTTQPPGAATMLLSAGQADLGAVHDLHESTDRARWSLAERHVSVHVALTGSELAVDIRSDKAGEFTWPVMELGPPVTALVWPYWEGRYVPLDDERWRSFLTGDEWNTLDKLCMPFWGLQCSEYSVTYIATNRFNNVIRFRFEDGNLQAAFTHTFPKSRNQWAYGFVIRLNKSMSPVEPAREFRRWVLASGKFVPMSTKARQVPKVAWLLGAPHAYLWGDALLSHHDIKPRGWQGFCRTLVEQAEPDAPSVGRRIHELMNAESWKQVEKISALEWPDRYVKSEVCTELCRLLERRDFYDAPSWQGVSVPDDVRRLLARDRDELSTEQLCRLNGSLLRAAYPKAVLPVGDWGNGASVKMLRRLKQAGLERMRLCLAGWEGVEKHPEVARAANEMGYLFGTYDSFHSIHDPKLKGTDASWSTAQFDQKLYETGGIEREDGEKRGGFKQLGHLLSPHAARPYVEARVRNNMRNVPYNYYFIDCDAYGQVFDDYSPLHPSTQEQDAAARLDRVAWIRDAFGVVIGSEGGCSYFAPVIHVAEGMFTPVIGWGDSDMKNRDSEYYIGGYYPPDGPRNFVQPVPLKEEYVYLHYDPRFRLPLNEIVFHDSFVSTHHWGSSSVKFTNVRETVALTEMLYQCPPLYHLNLDEFETHRDRIVKHYEFFSPVHREVGFAPMTGFAWLTADRLVQRTTFDDRIELTANFSMKDFERDGISVPARSVVARWLDSGKTRLFRPGD
ncbi:MAG: hypothetical protein JSV19_11970 [Phycisphaerales bacterium]|nr:MAG: hypothetical protein JSV19_11970 [Phycisphaerales bacterium]